MKRYDPHESYNPNFHEEDWAIYQRHPKTLELAAKVGDLIRSGLVARIQHSILCDNSFDVMARVDYGAATLQVLYSPHWSALAIAMLTHGCFENYEDEKVIRFYLSPSTNPLMYPPNIEWEEDVYGRQQPVWKGTVKAKKMKQLELYEF